MCSSRFRLRRPPMAHLQRSRSVCALGRRDCRLRGVLWVLFVHQGTLTSRLCSPARTALVVASAAPLVLPRATAARPAARWPAWAWLRQRSSPRSAPARRSSGVCRTLQCCNMLRPAATLPHAAGHGDGRVQRGRASEARGADGRHSGRQCHAGAPWPVQSLVPGLV